MQRIHAMGATAILRAWPFQFGIESLMHRLRPPVPRSGMVTKRLRGYPIEMCFDPQTMIGQYLYYRRMYEDPVVNTLRTFLKPGMTFVDVGANIGLFSAVAAHLVGPSGRVIAFEPQAKLAPLFRRTMLVNGFTQVTHSTLACGKAPATATLFHLSRSNDGMASLASVGSPATSESVTITTLAQALSDMGITRIDGLKVDIEGAELDLLWGSESFFRETPPAFILMECCHHHLQRFGATSQMVRDFLTDHGYILQGMDRGRWRPLPNGPISENILATYR